MTETRYDENMMDMKNIKEPESANFLHLTARFTRAIDYARQVHVNYRKGTSVPYVAHLLGVASLVMGESGHVRFPVTEDMVIGALLHDAVEDEGGLPRLRDIEANFGKEVAKIVEGCTDSFEEDSSKKLEWEVRKKSYIDRLRKELEGTLLVSAADKLYNARAILEDYRPLIAPLSKLDDFLRHTWLECCGHLSAFEVGGKRYTSEPVDEEMSMRARLSEVFEVGMKFFYEYDYGSPTALVLKVVALREQGLPKGAVQLLARNEAPQVSCQRCSIQPATQICTECTCNGEGWLCEACAVAHECGDEMCLPVVNSPRVGVCGYTG